MVVSRYLLFIDPSSPERSIFQPDTAGKVLWRRARDPNDFGGTATNCEKERKRFENYRPCEKTPRAFPLRNIVRGNRTEKPRHAEVSDVTRCLLNIPVYILFTLTFQWQESPPEGEQVEHM